MGFATGLGAGFDSAVLLVVVFQIGVFMGFAIPAYFLAGFVSKLSKKRKMIVRLTSWTIFLVVFLSLADCVLVYYVSNLEPERIPPNLLSRFTSDLVDFFVFYPLNVILLMIWALGVFLMFRTALLRRLRSVEKENVKQADNLSISFA